MITRGVSGIAISPKDPENQTEMLNAAKAAQDADGESRSRQIESLTDQIDGLRKQTGEALAEA